jgi:hypothetical protein
MTETAPIGLRPKNTGTRIKRVEDWRLLTGQGMFTDDRAVAGPRPVASNRVGKICGLKILQTASTAAPISAVPVQAFDEIGGEAVLAASAAEIRRRPPQAQTYAQQRPAPSGMGWRRHFRRVAKPIASTPNRLDVVFAARCLRQLFAQMADEHIDNLEFRLVLSAVEVAKKHLLGYGDALLPAKRLAVLPALAALFDLGLAPMIVLIVGVIDLASAA